MTALTVPMFVAWCSARGNITTRSPNGGKAPSARTQRSLDLRLVTDETPRCWGLFFRSKPDPNPMPSDSDRSAESAHLRREWDRECKIPNEISWQASAVLILFCFVLFWIVCLLLCFLHFCLIKSKKAWSWSLSDFHPRPSRRSQQI